jgi:hypothetical protein
LYEGEDLEFFTHLASVALIDRILCPFEQLGIPGGAVIQRIGRYSTHDVIGSKTIRQIGGQTLPLWIRAVVSPVGTPPAAIDIGSLAGAQMHHMRASTANGRKVPLGRR